MRTWCVRTVSVYLEEGNARLKSVNVTLNLLKVTTLQKARSPMMSRPPKNLNLLMPRRSSRNRARRLVNKGRRQEHNKDLRRERRVRLKLSRKAKNRLKRLSRNQGRDLPSLARRRKTRTTILTWSLLTRDSLAETLYHELREIWTLSLIVQSKYASLK